VLTLDLSGGQNVPLGTDAVAALGWWYIWVLYNGTTVSAVLSTSPTAPVLVGLLASYTYKAMVGSVYATSGVALHTMYQAGQDVWLDGLAAASVIFTAKALTVNYAVLAAADLTAFRIAVPPIARKVQGNFGSVAASASGLSISACKDDGTNDTAVSVGQVTIVGTSGAATFETFAVAGQYSVPVRGGTGNYNVQVRCVDAVARNRLTVTGYSL